MVALRKESVDRNMKKGAKNERTQKSLSARRAWIEIVEPTAQALEPQVALRKESVDRNPHTEDLIHWDFWSLSARRAWIEISGQR